MVEWLLVAWWSSKLVKVKNVAWKPEVHTRMKLWWHSKNYKLHTSFAKPNKFHHVWYEKNKQTKLYTINVFTKTSEKYYNEKGDSHTSLFGSLTPKVELYLNHTKNGPTAPYLLPSFSKNCILCAYSKASNNNTYTFPLCKVKSKWVIPFTCRINQINTKSIGIGHSLAISFTTSNRPCFQDIWKGISNYVFLIDAAR